MNKKQLINENKINNLINQKEDFTILSQIEQTKYLAYFFIKINNKKSFNAGDINPLYSLVGIKTPKNIRDLLNKLESRGILIKINQEFGLHRSIIFELDREFNFSNLKLKMTLDSSGLSGIYPEIIKVSEKLFNDGHYAQAIEEAFKRIILLVKKKSGKEDLDGCGLMTTVFSKDNPVLKFNKLVTRTDKDEQQGWMHIYQGAVLGIRDVKAHVNIVQRDKQKTIEYLYFASLLCRRLDDTIKS